MFIGIVVPWSCVTARVLWIDISRMLAASRKTTSSPAKTADLLMIVSLHGRRFRGTHRSGRRRPPPLEWVIQRAVLPADDWDRDRPRQDLSRQRAEPAP